MKIQTSGFHVEIDAEAMEAIRQWTHLARGEFSCLGVVTDDLFISSVYLFPQVCTDVSTDLDPAALAKFLANFPKPEMIRAWCHSHASMKVYWSAIDDATIEGLCNESFSVSIVVNKAAAFNVRVDGFRPLG